MKSGSLHTGTGLSSNKQVLIRSKYASCLNLLIQLFDPEKVSSAFATRQQPLSLTRSHDLFRL